MIKLIHDFFFMRDTHFTLPTYNSERSRMNFEFFFKFPIPKANKERIITERDGLGRIVSSKAVVYN